MKTTRRILFLLVLLMMPSWVSAQIGNSVLLDGNDDYISLPGSLGNYISSSGTISMWIRPIGTSPTINYAYDGQSIFADNGNYMGISRGIIAGQDRIWLYNYDYTYYNHRQVGIPYNAGEWTHIAWVLEGSYLKAYKNGALVDSISSGPTGYTAYSVNIGTHYSHFSGFVDEVNTWNRAITPAEVLNNYQNALVGNESGLTALWHFSETSGTIAADSSANAYNATLYNGAAFGPPFQPTGLIAKGDNQKITLLWDRNTIGNVLKYKVYRDTLPNPVALVDSTTDTTVTHTLLTNFKRYYFRVATVDSSNKESAYADVSGVPTTLVEVSTNLPQISQGATAWGDLDSDGDLDVLLVGTLNGYTGEIAEIYKNDGSGNFTNMNAGLLGGLRKCSIALGDFDGDGILDLAYTGTIPNSGGERVFHLYHNNGNSTFTELFTGIQGVAKGSMAFGDYDNDGDLDLIIMGNDGSTNRTRIYRNDGSATFTEINAGIVDAQLGSVAWGDYDKDGDLDLLITGTTDPGSSSVSGGKFFSIYRNDGGSFVDIGGGFPGAFSSSAAWGDYDNDGYLDFAYTGAAGYYREFQIYHNDGNGAFSSGGTPLAGFAKGQLSWGDFDNDGDLDILINGEAGEESETQFSWIYRNNGGSFEAVDAGLEGIGDNYGYPSIVHSAGFADYDKDGDLDVLLNGEDNSGNYVTKLYKNVISSSNNAPTQPAGLLATTVSDTVFFSWNKSTDVDQPQNGLTYNLHIGTATLTENIMPSMAKLTGGGGFRRVVGMGNTGHKNGWKIWGLEDGKYFWGVNAIDHNYKGSFMSLEQMLDFNGPPEIPQNAIAIAGNQQVSLKWNKVPDPDFKLYYIYRSLDRPGADTLIDSTAYGSRNDTARTINGLVNGLIYYFRITAADSSAHISNYSNEVSAIPSTTPGHLYVTNTNYYGSGSLPNAIDSANFTTSPDTITFLIPKNSTINLYNDLPALTAPFTYIDGDSDKNGTPDIEIDGSNDFSGGIQGFTIESSNNVIKGLVISGFYYNGGGQQAKMAREGSLSKMSQQKNSRQESVALHRSPPKKKREASLEKVNGNLTRSKNALSQSKNSRVNSSELPKDNSVAVKSDNTNSTAKALEIIIRGSGTAAITLSGAAAQNNFIIGNYVGTDLSGNGYSSYGSNDYGIVATGGANNNHIGNGIAQGGNVVSNSNLDGVLLDQSSGNYLLGNIIGLSLDGTSSFGNGYDMAYYDYNGIRLYNGSNNNHIGDGTAGGKNIISANYSDGIYLDGNSASNDNNFILGNIIGLAPDGVTTMGNYYNGIHLYWKASNNQIGNATAGGRNLISSNQSHGIHLEDYYTNAHLGENQILGNYIGVDVTGLAAAGNYYEGIYLDGSGGESIVNTHIGNGTAGGMNVVSGNGWGGIEISSYEAHDNSINKNYIGVGVDGSTVVANDGDGIYIYESSNDTISNNVISGNNGNGITVTCDYNSSTGTVITGNKIGTNAAGTSAVPNSGHGIHLSGGYNGTTDNTVIGGTSAGLGNVISGNGYSGITLGEGSNGYVTYTEILGNFIGTNAAGTVAIPNGEYGIWIYNYNDQYTSIGNGTAGGRNVISGNVESGISFEYTSYNTIMGNYIGTDVTGNSAIPNGEEGIGLYTSSYNQIGDTTAGARNVISGNAGHGIEIGAGGGTTSYYNDIIGNFIGTKSDGIGALANHGDGLLLQTTYMYDYVEYQNIARNTIAFNDSSGIHLDGATTYLNLIFKNSVYSNVSGGISITNGAQEGVWPPNITSVVAKTISGNASPNALVQVYSDAGSQGKVFMDTTRANGAGLWSKLFASISPGFVTALQDSAGNTSAFSQPVVIAAPPVLTLGALSVKALSKYMTVYLYSDKVLAAKSAQFTLRDAGNNIIDSQSPALAAVPGQPTLYSTPYKLTATGTLKVDATGTDVVGNVSTQTKSYGITSLSKNEAIAFTMGDLEISGVRGSVSQDGFLVISRTDENSAALSKLMRTVQNEHESNVQSETINLNGAWTQIGSSVEILSTTEITKALTININYNDQALNALKTKYPDFDVRRIGFYREQDGTLVYAGGEGSALSVNSKIDQLGKFTVYYNPNHAFLPKSLELAQNYPNPFNPTTTIKFGLPELGKVKLVVYNILGQRVMELVNGTRPAGYHTVIWNGRNSTGNQVASGVYIYRLETPKGVQARKMLFIK